MRAWAETDGREGKPADLTGMDLRACPQLVATPADGTDRAGRDALRHQSGRRLAAGQQSAGCRSAFGQAGRRRSCAASICRAPSSIMPICAMPSWVRLMISDARLLPARLDNAKRAMPISAARICAAIAAGGQRFVLRQSGRCRSARRRHPATPISPAPNCRRRFAAKLWPSTEDRPRAKPPAPCSWRG